MQNVPSSTQRFPGTIKGGSATCPICRYTTPATNVRRQLSQHRGGASNARLYAVVVTRPNETGRIYRCPTEWDLKAIASAKEKLKSLEELDPEATPTELLPPERPSPNTRGLSPVARIGVRHFRDLFAARPTLALVVYARLALTLPLAVLPTIGKCRKQSPEPPAGDRQNASPVETG
jgi:putative DNA methylase